MAGSEKRQRNKQRTVRFTDEELQELERRASDAGWTLPAYLRACALGDAGPRAARKPPIRRRELLRLLGQIGRLGGNVNQIARALNTLAKTPGDDPHGLTDDIKASAVEIAEMSAAVMKALGRVHE